MKRILLVLATSVLLSGCNNSDKKPKVVDMTSASRGELEIAYQKLPDSKIREVFMQQNSPNCVTSMKQGGVAGDVNSICNCITGKMADKLGVTTVRKLLLPSHVLSESEKNQLDSQSMAVMPQALAECK